MKLSNNLLSFKGNLDFRYVNPKVEYTREEVYLKSTYGKGGSIYMGNLISQYRSIIENSLIKGDYLLEINNMTRKRSFTFFEIIGEKKKKLLGGSLSALENSLPLLVKKLKLH